MSPKRVATGYHYSSSNGQDLDFAVDGKEYTSADGYSEIWTQAGERTWDTTEKVSGKAYGTAHHVLSADGKTLTDTAA